MLVHARERGGEMEGEGGRERERERERERRERVRVRDNLMTWIIINIMYNNITS